jgi:gas vesicle protein
MKRKMIKVFVVLVMLSFAFLFSTVAHAEETDVEQDEIVDSVPENVPVDEPTEEPVDFRTMLKDFLDKWLSIILATFGGAGGTAVAMLIAKKILNKMIETNKESNAVVNETKEVIDKKLTAIVKHIEEFEDKYSKLFEETMKRIKHCVDDIEELECNDEKFKELIALLVSSTPQLASNGYATKILELLNERSDSNE